MTDKQAVTGKRQSRHGLGSILRGPQDVLAKKRVPWLIIPAMILLSVLIVFLQSRAECTYLHELQVAFATQQAGPGYAGHTKITMPLATLLIRCGEQLITLIASWALFAGGIWLAGLISGENTPTLKAVTSVTLWSWIPYVVRAVVQAIYLGATQNPIYNPGLSGLFVDRTPPPIGVFDYIPHTPAQVLAAAVFAQIDVYLFWQMGLMVLGVSAITSFSRKRSWLIVMSLTLIWVAIGTLVRMPRFR